MEIQERIFSVDEELSVCTSCFEDYGIQVFIKKNCAEEPYDFCECSQKNTAL